jgi:poly(A) polymerase
MLKKLKKILFEVDAFLFKLFRSHKSIKYLQNMREVQILFSVLNNADENTNVKFVGGCIRKSLNGELIDDIDLATLLEPDEVKEKLNKENIQVIDTGIEHGTVTAIINNKKFEITTLRRDILTDGRHAEVKFTTDWKEDALRRDFTINAIYADLDGRIFDPFNGESDLKKGQVKFIGLPEKRIKEDYLRILRYFRFSSQYSRFHYKDEDIQEIKKNINGINKISKERIFDELKKILLLNDLYGIFLNDDSKECILNIFPQFKFYKRLKTFKNLDSKLKLEYDFNIILAILIVDHSDNYEFFCFKYKVSNDIKSRLKIISNYYESLKNNSFFSDVNIKKLIYFLGKRTVKDFLLFSKLANNKLKDSDLINKIKLIDKYSTPKFPISGNDLKEYGYEKGPELGLKLKSLEEKWVNNNFVLEDQFLRKYLKKIN